MGGEERFSTSFDATENQRMIHRSLRIQRYAGWHGFPTCDLGAEDVHSSIPHVVLGAAVAVIRIVVFIHGVVGARVLGTPCDPLGDCA